MLAFTLLLHACAEAMHNGGRHLLNERSSSLESRFGNWVKKLSGRASTTGPLTTKRQWLVRTRPTANPSAHRSNENPTKQPTTRAPTSKPIESPLHDCYGKKKKRGCNRVKKCTWLKHKNFLLYGERVSQRCVFKFCKHSKEEDCKDTVVKRGNKLVGCNWSEEKCMINTTGAKKNGRKEPRSPSKDPTREPTDAPTKSPTTKTPTTKSPTSEPTKTPTKAPTNNPSKDPTSEPTDAPTKFPTTKTPTTKSPTSEPSKDPTSEPTDAPTKFPTTKTPTTKSPTTKAPTTKAPTKKPSKDPPRFCANENEDCSCSGNVFYGRHFDQPAEGKVLTFSEMVEKPHKKVPVTGSISCSNDVMGGDPSPGFMKKCFCSATETRTTKTPTKKPSTDSPRFCANEKKDCSCSGNVFYGRRFDKPAGGNVLTFSEMIQKRHKKVPVTGSIKCSSDVMGGDPAFGFKKQCFCVKK